MTLNWENIFHLLYLLNIIIALWIMVKVLLGNRNPFVTISWVFVLLFIPLLGLILYFFFGRDTRRLRYIHKRFGAQIQERAQIACHSIAEKEIPLQYKGLAKYLENVSEAFPETADVELIPDTTLFMESLLKAIEGAREHINLQFYILEDDECGKMLLEALAAKAREGVEVRILYDSVGCWRCNPRSFDIVRDAGGEVNSFLKVRFPFLSRKTNYRNHRKIVVVDGEIGFVGGCNIANRYLQGINGGCWRDTMLSVTGYGVYGLQSSFLVDWFLVSGEVIGGRRYFPAPPRIGSKLIQIAPSNPVGQWRTIPSALVMALSSSRRYVYIQTPYLMPKDQVLTAIESAALSGVDVRLMIPMRSDSYLADYASRSYLERLMRSGVKVYMYSQGMLHAKSFVADDMLTIIGSANMDFRSFDYNFEVSAYTYDEEFAGICRAQFLADAECCTLLSLREFHKRPFGEKIKESLARLFSPIL